MDLTAHMAEIGTNPETEPCPPRRDRDSCKADGSGNKKQDKGKGAGRPRLDAVRTGGWRFPPSAVRRGSSLLKGSAAFACQGEGDCAQLRRAVDEERRT